jgi:hypothetical protein
MRRRKRVSGLDLEWPEWLIEWASRDTPPAELSDPLLARLKAAGVTELRPADADARALLEAEEHARANAIGAAGPGFAFAEELEGGATPVADALARLCVWVERYDLLRVLRLGAIDMQFAASAARALVDEDGPARVLLRVLETGLVVTYARPYLESNTRAVGRKWWPHSPDDRKLHERIIEDVRSPYHAHADRTPHRTLVDTAAMLGLDGPPTFAEGWSQLSIAELEHLAELAERQAARLHAAADEIGAELGEERVQPSYQPTRPRVDYLFDDGIEAASARLREAFGDRGDTVA